jgi:hypothetical protein
VIDRNHPEPGFFRMRTATRGEVAAQIANVDGVWSAWIDGRLIAEPSPFSMVAGVYRVWHNAERISSTEYRRLLGEPVSLAA